jgi:hypothetical protein
MIHLPDWDSKGVWGSQALLLYGASWLSVSFAALYPLHYVVLMHRRNQGSKRDIQV